MALFVEFVQPILMVSMTATGRKPVDTNSTRSLRRKLQRLYVAFCSKRSSSSSIERDDHERRCHSVRPSGQVRVSETEEQFI